MSDSGHHETPWEGFGEPPPPIETPRSFPSQAATVVQVHERSPGRPFPPIEVEFDDGQRTVVDNNLYPEVEVGTRLWIFPAVEEGMQLYDSRWLLPGLGVAPASRPVTLGDLEVLFAGYEYALHKLLKVAHADRGHPGTTISRVKIDEISQQLLGSGDPALVIRGRALGSHLTFGDLVLKGTKQGQGRKSNAYGWGYSWKTRARIGGIADPTSRPVRIRSFHGELSLACPDGTHHPHPGLYLLSLAHLSERVGPVRATVVGVAAEQVEVSLFGMRHVIPRSGLGWNQLTSLWSRFQSGQKLLLQATLPLGDDPGIRLKYADLQEADWLPDLPPVGAVLPQASWRILKEDGRTQVLYSLRPGVELLGVVRDRWFPAWDEATDLKVHLVNHEERHLVLIDILSRDANRAPLTAAWEVGHLVTGTVESKAARGFVINIQGLACQFNPGLNSAGDDAEPRIGQRVFGRIREIDDDRYRLVVDSLDGAVSGANIKRETFPPNRTDRIGRLSLWQKTKILSELEVDEVRKGVVKNIADFGAFVDLGGIDGLLHISDMSWKRIHHPTEMVKTGDEIEVKILRIDREKEKIALGLKQKLPSPWENVSQKYPVGSRIEGEVVSVMNHGAFVKLEDGIEGLVHISEMSWTKRVSHPDELVKKGDKVEVVVLNINTDKPEISLGIKQTQPNPWNNVTAKFPVGTTVTGTVRNLANYGAFIELEEGVDGLLHINDMSWTRKIANPSEVLKKGDELTCLVISVDEVRKRIALSMKQLENDPWENRIPQQYKPGSIVEGKVTKITNFGVFVELEEQLEGLLHLSELGEAGDEQLKVGDTVKVKILRIHIVDRKIGLTRKLDAPIERPALTGDGKTSVDKSRTRVQLDSWSLSTGVGKFSLGPGVFGQVLIPPTDRRRFAPQLGVGCELEVEVVGYATKKKLYLFKLVSDPWLLQDSKLSLDLSAEKAQKGPHANPAHSYTFRIPQPPRRSPDQRPDLPRPGDG